MERRRFALRASGALKRKLTKGGELPPFVFNYPLLERRHYRGLFIVAVAQPQSTRGYLSSNDFSVIGDFCLVGCRQHRGHLAKQGKASGFGFWMIPPVFPLIFT